MTARALRHLRLLALLCRLLLIEHTLADLYLHNPRGSNNKLNEVRLTPVQNTPSFFFAALIVWTPFACNR
jgi:hypothetical protein